MADKHGYAELSDIEIEDGEPPSVALVPWSRGIMARRSHARAPVRRAKKNERAG